MFLKISQNSQENTCTRVSFLKKRDPGTGVFLRNSKKHLFYRIPLDDFFGSLHLYQSTKLPSEQTLSDRYISNYLFNQLIHLKA